MKRKIIISISSILIVGLAILLSLFFISSKPQENMQSKGYVSDEKTAIQIAESVWLETYGDKIYNQKPLIATLENGIWYVRGSLPKNSVGGVAEIEISQKDGKILKQYHGK